MKFLGNVEIHADPAQVGPGIIGGSSPAIAGIRYKKIAASSTAIIALGGNETGGTGSAVHKRSVNGGINWTAFSILSQGNFDTAIAYSEETNTFIVGRNSTNVSLNYFARSTTDGASWELSALYSGTNRTVRDLVYANGRWVAVTNATVTGTDQVLTSDDNGVNWVTRTTPTPARNWTGITYGNGLFVAVCDNTANSSTIMTSPDGIEWTNRTAVAGRWQNVAFGNGMFVAVSVPDSGDGQVLLSTDGINWTAHSVPNWFRSIVHSKGIFFATPVIQPRGICYSYDGINWIFLGSWVNFANDLTVSNNRVIQHGDSGSSSNAVYYTDITGGNPTESELQTLNFERLASEPNTDLVAGRVYYNTSDDYLYVYDGTQWNQISTGSIMSQLTELSDVNVTLPANRQLLVHDGTEFVNQKIHHIHVHTDHTDNTISINHGLNQENVYVQVYDDSVYPPVQIIPDAIEITDANNIVVTLSTGMLCTVSVIGTGIPAGNTTPAPPYDFVNGSEGVDTIMGYDKFAAGNVIFADVTNSGEETFQSVGFDYAGGGNNGDTPPPPHGTTNLSIQGRAISIESEPESYVYVEYNPNPGFVWPSPSLGVKGISIYDTSNELVWQSFAVTYQGGNYSVFEESPPTLTAGILYNVVVFFNDIPPPPQ